MLCLLLGPRGPPAQKKSPADMRQHAARDEIINSAVPPCFMVKPYPCRDTNISPATDVCPHVAEYLPHGFPCALSGPFDDLFFICISASQTLCRSIIAVISASTVCNLIFRYFSRMLRGCQAGFSVIIRFNSRLTLNVFNPCTRQASASVSAPAAAQPKQCMPRLDKKSCVSGYIFAISPIRSSLPTGPSSYSKSSISLFPLRRRRAAAFFKVYP